MTEVGYLLALIGSLFTLLLGLIGWIGAGIFRRLDAMNGKMGEAFEKIAVLETNVAMRHSENLLRNENVAKRQNAILDVLEEIKRGRR
jgi:hypothetical protein